VLTAYCALFRDEPIKGKTVLVHGGAGAVGFYAVQLARWGGAGKIIATVSREEQAAKARDAGADAVVNYKSADVQKQIETAAGGANAVHHIVEVNFGANAALDATLIANNGSLIAFGSDADATPRTRRLRLLHRGVEARCWSAYSGAMLVVSQFEAQHV
jgi:NADPH2:quinone reductase